MFTIILLLLSPPVFDNYYYHYVFIISYCRCETSSYWLVTTVTSIVLSHHYVAISVHGISVMPTHTALTPVYRPACCTLNKIQSEIH